MTLPGFVSEHDVRERALLAAARGGDERAFGSLLERYVRWLEECRGLTFGAPQQAEHATRNAVLTAWWERGLEARFIVGAATDDGYAH